MSPGYLTAVAATSSSTGVYNTNSAVVTTPVLGSNGSFFIVRHSDYTSLASTNYTLSLPTSAGTLAIPQLGGSLTLNGRDSKVHVTDYPVGSAGYKLLYSTAEIFTWQTLADGKTTVLVVYGGAGELHELAVTGSSSTGTLVEGEGVTIQQSSTNSSVILQFETTLDSRRIVQVGDLYVYIVDRNSAYNYWAPELSSSSSLIVNGPYLVRSASVNGTTLSLSADFNKTTTVELIGVPEDITTVQLNGATVNATSTNTALGVWTASVSYAAPTFTLADLSSSTWYTIDSLPEIQSDYDDSAWPAADHTNTTNPEGSPLNTPVSLYGSDYGFNTGSLLFRGHFTATGSETTFSLTTQGGEAYAASVWLNNTFLGSYDADSTDDSATQDLDLPDTLTEGAPYVFTVLVDQMGFDETGAGSDAMKNPRGILDYTFATEITWKLTGNLGGEDYADRVRGPLNEGGFFIERQGYHQPSPPLSLFTPSTTGSIGRDTAGVTFYTTNFTLDLPSDEWDIPLSLTFPSINTNSTIPYRAFIYVNGYQFGRYTSNIGPQTAFPVPEGILDYSADGENWLGIVLWALEEDGAVIEGGLEWVLGVTPVVTGRGEVSVVEAPAWTERAGAY